MIRWSLLFAYVLCLLFSTFQSSRAQVAETGIIRGRLTAEDNSNIPFATIILKKTVDSIVYKTALSDEQGVFKFEFVKDGDYLVEVRLLRFEKLTSTVIHISAGHPETDLGILRLKPTQVNLQTVTVTAEKPFIERQIDKTVVNIENSIVATGSSVLEVMQKLPGVQVRQDGQINLNGKAGVNVYIDGKPTLLSAEDLASMLSGMSASGVQKIEIMAKPSARYDAGGSGGIINIVKKRNKKQGVNGSIGLGAGQGRREKYNGNFDISYKTSKVNLFASNAYVYNKQKRYTTSLIDFFNNNSGLESGVASENDQLRTYKTSTPTVGMDLYLSDRTTLSVTGNATIQRFNNSTDSHSEEYDSHKSIVKRYIFTNDTKDKLNNYAAGMHFVHKLDTTGAELAVDADYADYSNSSYQWLANTTNDAAGNFLRHDDILFDQRGGLKIYAAKADYVQPLKKNMRLEAGLKTSYVDSRNDNDYFNIIGEQHKPDSSRSSYFHYTEHINAAYLNLNREFGKLTLQLGLRMEQTIGKGEQLLTGQVTKQDYLQFFPSFFLDYKINDKHGLNVQLGRRIDRPAYADKNPMRRILNTIYYTQGDPNLRPQLSYNNAVTYSYQNELFASLGFTLYNDYLTKSSFPDVDSGVLATIPVNIHRAYAYNIDLNYSKSISNWWSVNNTLYIYYKLFDGNVSGTHLNNSGLVSFYASADNSFTIDKKTTAQLTFWYENRYQEGPSIFKSTYSLGAGLKRMFFNNKIAVVLNASDILWTEPYRWKTSVLNMKESWKAKNDTRVVKLNITYRFGTGKSKKPQNRGGADEEKKRAIVNQ